MGSEGECSRRSEDDAGDGSRDAERPLKKARYVWQVKGKYHLKKNFKEPSHSQQGSESPPKITAEEEIPISSTENNNNVGCGRRCCIEHLLARSEAIMAIEESSDEDSSAKNIDKAISDEIPVTLVKPNPKNQDYYLMKWQARQMAKGYLDNTINQVLESLKVAPFDAADLVENCDNDGLVEDEGILMAIQSHGLQSGVHNWGESSSNGGINQPNSAFMKPQELSQSALDNYQNVHNELLKNKSKEEVSSNDSETFEGDHTNFLDAAVSVAIQKKGLTSQNFV